MGNCQARPPPRPVDDRPALVVKTTQPLDNDDAQASRSQPPSVADDPENIKGVTEVEGRQVRPLVCISDDPVFSYITEVSTRDWRPQQRPLDVGERLVTDNNISEVVISEVIGQGNFGTVYSGRFCDQDVAVKEITVPEYCDEIEELVQLVQDWKNEVEVCMMLDHPSLVRTLGYSSRPALIIIQELVAKGSLYDLQQSGFRATEHEQILMGTDVAGGMEYLHAQTPPIIHRDLKSLNLLVEEDNRLKITDFGLARAKAMASGAYGHTQQMTECGTPYWSAPELLRGEMYNESVDQFAFAMTMVEIVTGQPPWTSSPGKCMIDVNKGLRPVLPPDTNKTLCSLMGECWAQQPEQRPSFGKVLLQLETLCAEQGVKCRVRTSSS